VSSGLLKTAKLLQNIEHYKYQFGHLVRLIAGFQGIAPNHPISRGYVARHSVEEDIAQELIDPSPFQVR